MRYRTLKRNSGIAMVIVTALLALMLGIVLSVVALNQAGGKHTAFFKNRQIALIMAKAGVADALYRMNYLNYSISDYPTTSDPWFLDNNPFGTDFVGTYSIAFTDNALTKNEDKITSTGKYNGKIRKISVKVRGDNTAGSALNTATHGIEEAFNKHAIYAYTVNTGANSTVNGNITYVNGTIANGGNSTQTTITATTFQNSLPTPTISSYDLSAPAEPAYACLYTDNDDAVLDVGEGNDSLDAGPAATYDPVGDSYTFDGTDNISSNSQVDGDVILTGSSQVNAFLKGEAILITSTSVTISASATLYTAGDFTCAQAITINGTIYAGGTISLSNCTVNGNIIGGSTINLSNITITGNIKSAGAINITTKSGSATVTGNVYGQGAVTITGDGDAVNDIVGTVVSDSSVTLQINILYITPANTYKPAIVVYDSAVPGNGDITFNSAVHVIRGLVYASGDITINKGTITGTLAAGYGTYQGTVTLANDVDVSVTFDTSNYVDCTNATPLYENFSGGRRIYVPVLDSWREE